MYCTDCGGNNLVIIYDGQGTTPSRVKCPDCLLGITTVSFADYLSTLIKGIVSPSIVSFQNNAVKIQVSETLSITVQIGNDRHLEIFSHFSSNTLVTLINRLKEYGLFDSLSLIGYFPIDDVRCPLCGGNTFCHLNTGRNDQLLACANVACLKFSTSGEHILIAALVSLGLSWSEENFLTFRNQTVEILQDSVPVFAITYRQEGSRHVILFRGIASLEANKPLKAKLPEKIFEFIPK